MFQERSRMSAAHEANTQRLTSALRDKESALQVRQWLQTHQLCADQFEPEFAFQAFVQVEFARGVFLGFGS